MSNRVTQLLPVFRFFVANVDSAYLVILIGVQMAVLPLETKTLPRAFNEQMEPQWIKWRGLAVSPKKC
jgi:hypothetical protein